VTEALEKKDVDTRACHLRTESKHLRTYQIYSQSACIFECSMAAARSACGGCSPWNYPRPADDNGQISVCMGAEVPCFEKELAKASSNVGKCKYEKKG